jgi:hypothetical protein
MGVDARGSTACSPVDAEGNITAVFPEWDDKFRRPHSITINPYDAEKHIWVVEDRNHVVYKFTNDGKQLLQTLGIPVESGNDDKHFNRPTFSPPGCPTARCSSRTAMRTRASSSSTKMASI